MYASEFKEFIFGILFLKYLWDKFEVATNKLRDKFKYLSPAQLTEIINDPIAYKPYSHFTISSVLDGMRVGLTLKEKSVRRLGFFSVFLTLTQSLTTKLFIHINLFS